MYTFYDMHGDSTAYTEDSVHIYLFDGRAVAYISGDSIYSYSGKHLGWFENGWVRDHSGHCVFFTENASGSGPARPAHGARPAKSAKSAKHAKGAKSAKPVKSVKSLSWSSLSGEEFFYQ